MRPSLPGPRASGHGPVHPQRSNLRGNANTVLVMAVVAVVAVAALVASVGADARWLAALGRVIVGRHSIPTGVPFATAPSSHWPNVLVAAEIAFWELENAAGDRGLMVAQLIAVGIAFTVLARDARAGRASPGRTAVALGIAALGALPSLAIARVQLFSLALFPVTVALLRSEARRPSRRIWLLVPLFALWANLHGGVLIGLLVALVYLAIVRVRSDPVTAVTVALASISALFLNPALTRTLSYYRGVLTNVAAQRGVGLWAPIRLGTPLDDLAIAAAVILGLRLRRSRPPVWEWIVIVVLAVASIRTSRSTVWLLFFLVAPAATLAVTKRPPRMRLVSVVSVAASAAIAWAIVRGPIVSGSEQALTARAVALARGGDVLAPDHLGEQVAFDGGRIWLGNPLDAFSRRDQGIYLDWLDGRQRGLEALTDRVRVVLVMRGSATQRLMASRSDFTPVAIDRTTVLYRRAD